MRNGKARRGYVEQILLGHERECVEEQIYIYTYLTIQDNADCTVYLRCHDTIGKFFSIECIKIILFLYSSHFLLCIYIIIITLYTIGKLHVCIKIKEYRRDRYLKIKVINIISKKVCSESLLNFLYSTDIKIFLKKIESNIARIDLNTIGWR